MYRVTDAALPHLTLELRQRLAEDERLYAMACAEVQAHIDAWNFGPIRSVIVVDGGTLQTPDGRHRAVIPSDEVEFRVDARMYIDGATHNLNSGYETAGAGYLKSGAKIPDIMKIPLTSNKIWRD